jgi:hypothetical protein
MTVYGTPEQERAFAAEFIRGVSHMQRGDRAGDVETVDLVCDILDLLAGKIASGEHIRAATP